jgi:hypothetical protein
MRRFAAILYLCSVAGTVQAQDLCDQLSGLMKQETAGEFAIPVLFESQAKCRLSRTLSGGIAHHCGWPFAFRASEANEAFVWLLDGVAKCLGKGAVVTTDDGVNHPDSYDLKMFRTEAGTVGVSLKDKSALQQTYVFLRVEKTPAQ